MQELHLALLNTTEVPLQMQTGSLVPGLFKESDFLLVNTIIYVHVT